MSAHTKRETVTTVRSESFGGGIPRVQTTSVLKEFVDAVMDAGLEDEELTLRNGVFEETYRFVVERREPIEEDSE